MLQVAASHKPKVNHHSLLLPSALKEHFSIFQQIIFVFWATAMQYQLYPSWSDTK